MEAYYLMCCMVGMKHLLAAELRLLLGTCLCLILLVQKASFPEATIYFLNNSMSALSDSVMLNRFYLVAGTCTTTANDTRYLCVSTLHGYYRWEFFKYTAPAACLITDLKEQFYLFRNVVIYCLAQEKKHHWRVCVFKTRPVRSPSLAELKLYKR